MVKIVFLDYLSFPSELGVLCALARVNPRVRVFQVAGKFARAAQILRYSNAENAKGFVLARCAPYVFFVPFVVNLLLRALRVFVVNRKVFICHYN